MSSEHDDIQPERQAFEDAFFSTDGVMSPEQLEIRASGAEAGLERAIKEQAQKEARQILNDAQAQVERIRGRAQARADAEREAILARAREEDQALRSHAAAAARLGAHTLKLKRRELLLDRVFDNIRQQLASAPDWPDYQQIVRRLLHEAVHSLGTNETLVLRADERTRQLLDESTLANLAQELGVRLRVGTPLPQGTGVVLETLDGHRRYDNTLEHRLARMRETLRTPVYHILMGGEP
jgi:V/A-type H+-transporting ATPase subunit E